MSTTVRCSGAHHHHHHPPPPPSTGETERSEIYHCHHHPDSHTSNNNLQHRFLMINQQPLNFPQGSREYGNLRFLFQAKLGSKMLHYSLLSKPAGRVRDSLAREEKLMYENDKNNNEVQQLTLGNSMISDFCPEIQEFIFMNDLQGENRKMTQNI